MRVSYGKEMISLFPAPSISPAQSRAARAWLNISQQELAAISLVNKRTIADFERGASTPYERTLRDLQRALEEKGIVVVFEGQRGIGVSECKIAPDNDPTRI